jgi:hypothetical protein
MSLLSPETQAASLGEAARILGYRNTATVRHLIASGQLQAFRAKSPSGLGAWRISRASIARLLAGQRDLVADAVPGTAPHTPPPIDAAPQA